MNEHRFKKQIQRAAKHAAPPGFKKTPPKASFSAVPAAFGGLGLQPMHMALYSWAKQSAVKQVATARRSRRIWGVNHN